MIVETKKSGWVQEKILMGWFMRARERLKRKCGGICMVYCDGIL